MHREYNSLLAIAREAADIGSSLMLQMSPQSIIGKGDRDMVSEVDLEIERKIYSFLAVKTPEIAFISEEEHPGRVSFNRPTWVLDPIDGTANFTRRIPTCATSLALFENGHPIVGVVNMPFIGSSYYSSPGGGAYRDGQVIKASSNREIQNAVIAIGDYAVGDDASSRNTPRFALTETLATLVLRIRMIGSVAADLVWLADGLVDASITFANNPWDVGAGIAIAREAGAVALDMNGHQYTAASGSTIATAPGMTGTLQDLLKSAMNRADTGNQWWHHMQRAEGPDHDC
jgi:myo-inositol-1(or 4)-monophosphatase